MENPKLIVSAKERELLKAWLISYNPPDIQIRHSMDKLLDELAEAEVREEDQIPSDVVRLHSIVDISTPAGRREGLKLVMPADADLRTNRLSVMSVMGAALIGFREGSTIVWRMPKGEETITLERVDNSECPGSTIPLPKGR